VKYLILMYPIHSLRSSGRTQRQLFSFLLCALNAPHFSPLNSIGLPCYTSALLSADIPPALRYPSNLPTKIPPQILKTVNWDANGMGSAAFPSELKGKRNMVTARSTNGKSSSKARFRSAKSKEVCLVSSIISSKFFM
jgi:hypothetical protein